MVKEALVENTQEGMDLGTWGHGGNCQSKREKNLYAEYHRLSTVGEAWRRGGKELHKNGGYRNPTQSLDKRTYAEAMVLKKHVEKMEGGRLNVANTRKPKGPSYDKGKQVLKYGSRKQ